MKTPKLYPYHVEGVSEAGEVITSRCICAPDHFRAAQQGLIAWSRLETVTRIRATAMAYVEEAA